VTRPRQKKINHFIDLATFSPVDYNLNGVELLLVVKSLDQAERRRRFLEGRKGDRFGRIQARPVSRGLLVFGRLADGRVAVSRSLELDEPRHACLLQSDRILLTEMDRVLTISLPDFTIQEQMRHPFFAFLHTVDISADCKHGLIVSSGYDAVFEVDLLTRQIVREWRAWEHGFNPDEDGVWLAAKPEYYDRYRREGKRSLLIDPVEYGRQGLLTTRRTAHPNMAVYDRYRNDGSFFFAAGHNGTIYRVHRKDLSTESVFELGDQMPHGLRPFQGGWCLTNTVRGEWWLLNQDFTAHTVYSAAMLEGKVEGTESVEWLQQTVPVGKGHALFLDANRGLIAVDLINRTYTRYGVNPEWCVQDAVLFT